MTQGAQLYVGIDWALKEHKVLVLDLDGKVQHERNVTHTGEKLAEFCAWLSTLCDDRSRIWIAIEVPHGPVVEILLERGFKVFSLNPKQTDRFRDRFYPAGAKDDRRDALVLATSLRTDPHCYRELDPEEPLVIEIREWSRIHSSLGKDSVRLANQLREALGRYYGQALELTTDVSEGWFLDLIEHVPTPDAAKRVRAATIAKILKNHRIRRHSADSVLQTLRGTSFTVAPGTIAAATATVRLIVQRLNLYNEQAREVKLTLEKLLAKFGEQAAESGGQRDAEILLSMPGVGRIVVATLLAEAYRALVARDYQGLRTLCGVAPVTQQSGKKRRVLMRQACNPRLRDAVYHWARVASQRDHKWKAKYAALRARGHSHGRALRGIADRLLSVACAMLKEQSFYRQTGIAA